MFAARALIARQRVLRDGGSLGPAPGRTSTRIEPRAIPKASAAEVQRRTAHRLLKGAEGRVTYDTLGAHESDIS